ncbi:LysR substrate-binding domain-containing protein [Chelatococcus sp. SYSU_G07232]|uniref:LysR substrate-binding domain-containing protein n=1 Tax=Chelatococcus albus TaxID=3047466 RepID=A0ABT7AIK3_9HYPH|nr:LysR substrate-binding domain-containing protein [Chelatococcus sp. SYSU_G07232]MDJ1158426.1 LysR substrate-binding domain-containing protein [Chelatococcus sp. SYSU_G07232]
MDHSSSALPPLDTLRAFEAAARTGSFSAAAQSLHLTHGAISRQIGRLEQWLGQRLFERRARGVALTPDGQRLYQRTSEAFALIADTSDRWIEPRGSTVVKLTTIPSVCGLWLLPRLAALEAGAPRLQVELLVDHRHLDLETENIDLAIRCGRGSLPGRACVQLFEEHCFPIASPEVAAAAGSGDVARLLAFPLIHDSDASKWRAWFAAHGVDYRLRRQDRRFEDYNLVLDAAANGLGITLARPPLAEEALRTGRLIADDPRTVLILMGYFLDRPVGRMRPAAAELTRRIMATAGVEATAADAFLRAER